MYTTENKSLMPVSTSDLALKDLQEKQGFVDELDRKIQLRSQKNTMDGSYVKPVQQTPISPAGYVQSIPF